MKALTRLGQRRYAPVGGYSLEQARELAALSRLLGRQIGLLLDRQGRVDMVLLGEPGSILIPALSRSRTGAGRLRGLRLLHTHLGPAGLSQEDLMDLLFLRLDSVGVLTVDEFGGPLQFQSAHLLPAAPVIPGRESAGEPVIPSRENGAEEHENLLTVPIEPEAPASEDESALEEREGMTAEPHTPLRDGESTPEECEGITAECGTLPGKGAHPTAKPAAPLKARAAALAEKEKTYRVHPLQPWDHVTTDFTAEAESLEEELGRVQEHAVQAGEEARAVLVSVASLPRDLQERHLTELAELARTAHVTVVGSLVQRVGSVNPRHILSKTKLAELEVLALRGHASLIIFDGELSPAQLNSLAEMTERKVLDRTQLILDIFARHATTGAGKLQVEMAQLQYAQPRLVGKNRAMDRLMGGIGGRGPGETKLETDRRRIRDRIARIKKELDELRRQRTYTRSRRQRQGLPLAALVGYTNAGKSTLLNALTKAAVLAENKLFATLDPTTRRLRFPKERELVLADTVGFIRNLPKELVESFRATLEELEAADLLIHVADASHPEFDAQFAAVEHILADLDLHGIPSLLLLNKWDAAPEDIREGLRLRYPEAIPVSALSGEGLDKLSKKIERLLFEQ